MLAIADSAVCRSWCLGSGICPRLRHRSSNISRCRSQNCWGSPRLGLHVKFRRSCSWAYMHNSSDRFHKNDGNDALRCSMCFRTALIRPGSITRACPCAGERPAAATPAPSAALGVRRITSDWGGLRSRSHCLTCGCRAQEYSCGRLARHGCRARGAPVGTDGVLALTCEGLLDDEKVHVWHVCPIRASQPCRSTTGPSQQTRCSCGTAPTACEQPSSTRSRQADCDQLPLMPCCTRSIGARGDVMAFAGFHGERLHAWMIVGAQQRASALHDATQEASCICRGNASRVMGMASAMQADLWAAVEAGNGARYAEISDALELQPAPRTGRGPSVPLRLGLLPSRGACSVVTWLPTYVCTHDARPDRSAGR